MKHFLILSFCNLLVISALAQKSVKEIVSMRPERIGVYETSDSFRIAMPFAKSTIVGKQLPDNLDEVYRIDLVYTEFRRKETFNQPALNVDRLKALQTAYPMFFKKEIEWRVFEQTAAKTPDDAKKLFHGFILHTEAPFREADVAFIKEVLEGTNTEPLPDSTIIKTFDRNRNWDKMLIVADLTGSMSPYVAEVLIWFKLMNVEKRAKHFVFFNDGDQMKDEDKKVGQTGGIYQAPAQRFEAVEALAYQTIRNGDGGDWEENDIEAILKGLKACPDCKDVILIADNASPVRDARMMTLVKKPVRVIVCGMEEENSPINPVYLDLARQTGGSVHTLTNDLQNLMKINEGETVELAGRSYKIYKGEFKLLR